MAEDISNEEPLLSDHTSNPTKSGRPEWWQWKVPAAALLLPLCLQLLMMYTMWINSREAVDCASYTQQYSSPLLEDIKVHYDTVAYNGSFMKQTIYRRQPSPEVDAAWDALGANLGPFIVEEGDASRFGLESGMVKRQKSQGGGFLALSEGAHHLHCVNLLRQASHFNYQYYRKLGQGPFVNDEDVLEKHIGHCVDILRQQTMCTFDTGVFGSWWVKDVGPFVDFNTKHRCKNFNALRDWVVEHQLSKEDGDLVEFRDGDTRLPIIP